MHVTFRVCMHVIFLEHYKVRESLYRHEIELPDDIHRKKIGRVKESILAMKERTKILRDTILH